MTYDRNEAAFSSSARVPVQFAEMALRSAGQLFDMQLSGLRTVWQMQARAAAAFGFPDCSALFAVDGLDERMREMRASGAEQFLQSTQRASETVSEIQRQFGELVQTQAATAAQTWQQGLEQLGAQADESLQQWRSSAQQQAEQLGNATRAIGEQAQEGLREQAEEAGEPRRGRRARG